MSICGDVSKQSRQTVIVIGEKHFTRWGWIFFRNLQLHIIISV